MAVMTTQADVDTALTDFASKLAAVNTAFVAMATVQLPSTPYTEAAAQANAVKSASTASATITAQLAGAQAQANAIGAQVKLLLPPT